MAITYKDKTFCSSTKCKNECGRKITNKEINEAKMLKLPICFADFCSEKQDQLKGNSNDKN